MKELPVTNPNTTRYSRRERIIALAAAACLGGALWVAVERTDNSEEPEIMYEVPSGEEIEPAPHPELYPSDQS